MLRFTVMPGLPDVLCATPNTSSKYAAIKPPCTHAGAPSYCLVKVTVPTTTALPSSAVARSAAVALEQEMKAKVQEMQAKVVEAQAEVPLAMAEAFRQGKLGVMDYYKMENIQSDTAMRGSIAHPEGKK